MADSLENREFFYLSKSEKKTIKIATDWATKITGGDTICFFGDVGTGKTLFTKAFCKALGFDGYVNSPSYIIVNEYPLNNLTIYHYDLYRIGSIDELTEIGYYQFCGSPEAVTIIEWAEYLEMELPPKRVEIYLQAVNATTREIVIKDLR